MKFKIEIDIPETVEDLTEYELLRAVTTGLDEYDIPAEVNLIEEQ